MAGSELLTGSGVMDQALAQLLGLGGLKLEERGQNITWNSRLLSYYESEQAARNQYQRDVASFGLDQANLNFQQRQADASNELQRQGGILGRDDLNYRQRSDLAGKKLGVVDMLNSRRGPSNWVRYDSLLEGLDAPDAERSTTIDPFKLLEGLVQNSDAFTEPIKSVNEPYAGGYGGFNEGGSDVPSWLLEAAKPMGGSSGGGGGGSSPSGSLMNSSPAAWGSQGYATNRAPTSATGLTAQDIFSGVRNEDVAGLTTGQSALKVTGTGGSSRGRDYTNFRVANPATGQQYGPDDEIGAGTNVWLTRLGLGGMVKSPAMALTGDGTDREPNEDSEIAMAILGPDGQPLLKVLNPRQTKHAMRGGVMPKRAAGGGTYSGANTEPVIQVDDYGAEALGNQGFINRLRGRGRKPAFAGLGASLTNEKIGVRDMPSLLNLQNFRDLLPSQKEASAELYESGLDVNFDDILERSRRAAPFGRRFNTASYGY